MERCLPDPPPSCREERYWERKARQGRQLKVARKIIATGTSGKFTEAKKGENTKL